MTKIDRTKALNSINETVYDLLVIGGGITGAGIALDAASRGLQVLLIEKGDFASGTSSKSTKLIHGGLRYLKQFEFGLVRESGLERAVVYNNAKHLVRPLSMMLPIVESGSFSKITASLAVFIYDILAGVKRSERRQSLSKSQTLKLIPNFNQKILKGAVKYAEYLTDDARLTLELIKTACSMGADAINYLRFDRFNYDETGKIKNAICRDIQSDTLKIINSKTYVSAAGPWVDEIRSKDKSLDGKHLRLTKGVHLVVERNKLPLNQAVYFDALDGRMIFTIPRGQKTYIGTTDSTYNGDLNNVQCTKNDAQYLVDSVNHAFPNSELNLNDILSSWAGLRPLIHEAGKPLSEISRRDEIFESHTNLISIAGGKLTGYRKMAERVVDLIFKQLKERPFVKCKTQDIRICGDKFSDESALQLYKDAIRDQMTSLAYTASDADYLVYQYGMQCDEIITLLKQNYGSYQDKRLALIISELQFGLSCESIMEPLDFLVRRTAKMYFNIQEVKDYYKEVCNYIGNYYSWSPERTMMSKEDVQTALAECLAFKS